MFTFTEFLGQSRTLGNLHAYVGKTSVCLHAWLVRVSGPTLLRHAPLQTATHAVNFIEYIGAESTQCVNGYKNILEVMFCV